MTITSSARFAFAFILAAAVTMSGCNATSPVATDTGTEVVPAFASPCLDGGDCGVMDPCAQRNYSQCRGFLGANHLKQTVCGDFGQLDFRVQPLKLNDETPVSLWHDIPLIVRDDENGMIVNAFFEISRGSQAKVELNKWLEHNPIWQDRSEVPTQEFERPRYYAWSPAPGNYGALPQTWENVLEPDPLTGFPGDTDPIDVLDFGRRPAPTGLVSPVKVIGALGMIDGTDLQTDWKICVINLADPRAEEINDISEVPPQQRYEWATFWRFYKTASGLKQNFFYAPSTETGFSADAVWLGAEDAAAIVKTSADAYRRLREGCLNRQIDPPYWVPGCPVGGLPQTGADPRCMVKEKR